MDKEKKDLKHGNNQEELQLPLINGGDKKSIIKKDI